MTKLDKEIQEGLYDPKSKGDIQDLADEIKDNGGKINKDGTVTLYHFTTPESKKQIEKTGIMYGKEDGIFFSTRPDGQAIGYGSSIVTVKVPISKLELDDVFGNEAHLRIPTKRAGQAVKVNIIKQKQHVFDPSKQRQFEKQCKAKAHEGKKLKGQQKLTSAVSTSKRLSEFAYDTKPATIYIITDAKGNKKKVAYAEWLKWIKEQKRLYDPKSSVPPTRWYEAMVKGIKKSSDVRNPYAIVKSIWAKLSPSKRSEIKAREKKGEQFKYDLPLPVDKPTRGIGTVRMVKPFKLAEVQVNLSVTDYLTALKSGIFSRMKRQDGTTALVARCKSPEKNVNIFVDKAGK